jgi:hypothetical protein
LIAQTKSGVAGPVFVVGEPRRVQVSTRTCGKDDDFF